MFSDPDKFWKYSNLYLNKYIISLGETLRGRKKLSS